jgi:predicted dehydrogenase
MHIHVYYIDREIRQCCAHCNILERTDMKYESIGIGIAGYGMIGKLHTMNYRMLKHIYPGRLPELRLSCVMTSSAESAEKARTEGGFPSCTASLKELVHDPSVDAVDVSLPNQLHREAVLEAVSVGKAVYCEKPLAGNIDDARTIYEAVREQQTPFGMVFQYRFLPAVVKAKELLDSGAVGRIYSYRAEYLHSGYQDPERPISWRMKREEGGSGALGDLGSHVIDLMRYLLGDYAGVSCLLKTFIPERPAASGSSEKAPVTVDDAAWIRAEMQNGAVGTIEVSRFAAGTLDDLSFRIYGEHGSLRFSLMDPNFLYWFDAGDSEPAGAAGAAGSRGWKQLQTVQHYPDAVIPPGRAPIGWNRAHAENQYRFLEAVSENRTCSPGIDDGMNVQLVIDAAERSALHNGRMTDVQPLKA